MKNAAQFLKYYKQRGPMSLPICAFGLLLLMLVSPLVLARPDCDNPPCNKDDGGGVIPLSCFFMDAADDNIISDGGGLYDDGQENVKCSTGDTRGANLSGIALSTWAKGNIKRRVRQLDMAFSYSNEEGYIAGPTEGLPDSIFARGDGNPLTFDTENAWLVVRPYRDGTQDHIQNLPPGLYRMALDVRLAADYRFVLSMASRAVPDDRFQGVVCDITPQSDAETDDVSVIVWAPEDALNRYTVTTGQVVWEDQTWKITDGATRAALCSNVPIDGVPCGGHGSDMCNFMGWVDVQFTFQADNLP
jgi:hypothetical protein